MQRESDLLLVGSRRQLQAWPPRDATGHAATIEVTCEAIAQRNWSRVGTAATSSGPLFLKQFVTSDRRWLHTTFADERRGTDFAHSHLRSVQVLPVRGFDEEALVLAYEYRDITSPDQLLRRDGQQFASQWPSVLNALRSLVDELVALEGDATCHLPVKTRSYESRSTAVCFKGLEVRNLGVAAGDRSARPYFFDCGKPYVAPAEEVVAKLVVSTALLHWGTPVGLFAKGPPRAAVSDMVEALQPYVSIPAIEAELTSHVRQRLRQPMAAGVVQRIVKWLMLQLLGRHYHRQAREVLAHA